MVDKYIGASRLLLLELIFSSPGNLVIECLDLFVVMLHSSQLIHTEIVSCFKVTYHDDCELSTSGRDRKPDVFYRILAIQRWSGVMVEKRDHDYGGRRCGRLESCSIKYQKKSFVFACWL